LPGVKGPEFGGGGYTATIGSGPDAVVVSWTGLFPNDSEYFVHSPERELLDPLGARMISFDSWISDDTWAERNPCTVEASRFRVFVDAQPWGGSLADLPPDMADVPWPLSGDILSWGADAGYQPPDEPYHVERCGFVSRAEASRMLHDLREARAFDPFTAPTTLDAGPYVALALGDHASSRILQIYLQPVLPDDRGCGIEYRPGSSEI
jgi:hypothetical protein